MNSTLETFRVSDLRGGAVSPGGGSPTLEDPTGRRRSMMRLLGRTVAVVLGLWLAALLFAGLGVGPLANIPLVPILHPSASPPPLPMTLEPKPPTAADLEPALAAAQTKPVAGAVAPAQTVGKPPLTTAQPRRTRARTMPGKAAPHATPVPGPSPTGTSHASPTGQAHGGGKKTTTTTTTTSTTTTPGRSGAAPGQSRLPGSTSGR